MENISSRIYLMAIIAILVLPLSGLSIDIYVPSLPAVAHYFNVDKSLAQLTITTYMFGFGFLQLFCGDLSDSLGRKKPFIVAMVVYIIAAVLSPFSQSIYQLLLLRFVQGSAIAFLNVSMRAVISDLFSGVEFYKMINYVTIAWAMGPIIAPAIGGYLQYYFGWHAPFYFLAAYGVLMLLLNLFFMPETLREKKIFQLQHVLPLYRKILFHWEFVIGLICLGVLYSSLILFGVVCPFLIQTVLHYTAAEFGNMGLLMGMSWFLGNVTNRFFIEVDLLKKVKICFWAMLFISIAMLFFALIFPVNIFSILIPISLLLYFGGMIFPNYFAKNIALFSDTAATANALMGTFMVLIASCISALATLLRSDTQIPLAVAYIFISFICLLTYYFAKSKQKYFLLNKQNQPKE